MNVDTDEQGFLLDSSQWTPAIAEQIASAEGLQLTPAHWQILHLVREFFATYDHAPAMRALVGFTAQQLGAEKGRSVYLLQLFPDSPAKRAAKIAGLPHPDNCL